MQLTRGNRPAASGEAGFTITELLVATAMGLTVLGAVAGLNRFQLSAMHEQVRQNSLQMNARNIVDLFTREVRRAGMNPTCTPSIVAIAEAKQHMLHILSDFDGDGATSGPGEDVTYRYKFTNNILERVEGGSADPLLEGVSLEGSRLRYFDMDGVEVTAGLTGLSASQRDNVGRIRIELVATREAMRPESSPPLRVALANDVEIRNRYFGNAISCP